MLKTNYHTHTTLCNHAEGRVKDYVLKAIELGFEEIGISEHNPIPVSFLGGHKYMENWCHRNMSYDVFENIYLKELDEVINLYSDKIKIYKGLECEYKLGNEAYYKGLREKVDYLNLGLHFFCSGNEVLNTYDDVNYTNLFDYVNNACIAMKSGLFKIFVHPDLFMFDYKDENGNRVFDEHCVKATKMLVECAIENDVYLEINANGVGNSNKYGDGKTWLYPEIEFWKIVKEYDKAKIIIGADAHKLSYLDCEQIDKVTKMASDLGLKVLDKVLI